MIKASGGLFGRYLPPEVSDYIFSLLGERVLRIAQFTSKKWYLRCWSSSSSLTFEDHSSSIKSHVLSSVFSRTNPQKLHALSFLNCDKLSVSILPPLLTLTRLERLCFRGCQSLNMNQVLDALGDSPAMQSTLQRLEFYLLWESLETSSWQSLQKLTNLTRLHYTVSKAGSQGLPYLTALQKLRFLRVSPLPINPEAVHWFASLTNLHHLELPRCTIETAALRRFSTLTHLRSLDIHGAYSLDDSSLPSIAKLTNLTSLNLSETKITPKSIDQLANLRDLKKLILHKLENGEEQNFDSLGFLVNLNELSWSRTTLTATPPMNIKAFSFMNIRHLQIQDQGMTLEAFRCMAHMPLHTLVLSNTPVLMLGGEGPAGEEAYSEALSLIVMVGSLEKLSLGKWVMSWKDVRRLQGMGSLRVLILERLSCPSPIVMDLLSLGLLEELHLSGGSFHLEKLLHFPRTLKKLSLCFGFITYNSMQGFEDISLHELNLESTNINSEIFPIIGGITTLQTLNLSNCRLYDSSHPKHPEHPKPSLLQWRSPSPSPLTHLFRLRHLQTLRLEEYPVSDQDIKDLLDHLLCLEDVSLGWKNLNYVGGRLQKKKEFKKTLRPRNIWLEFTRPQEDQYRSLLEQYWKIVLIALIFFVLLGFFLNGSFRVEL